MLSRVLWPAQGRGARFYRGGRAGWGSRTAGEDWLLRWPLPLQDAGGSLDVIAGLCGGVQLRRGALLSRF